MSFKYFRITSSLFSFVLLAGCGTLGEVGEKLMLGAANTPPSSTAKGPVAVKSPDAGGKNPRVQSFKRSLMSPRVAQAQTKKAVQASVSSLDGNDGSSLWSDQSPFLFVDKRATKVGDIITVVISESSNAKKEADTEIDKDATLAYTIPAIPGYGEPLGTPGGRARRFDPSDTLRATTSNNSDIETEIERTDTLSATISAKVVEVLPNGNLFIEGHREISTHKETLIITLSGIIRPEDIKADNTVESRFIADARIVYTGDGVLAEAQTPGWLTRIATILWPF